MMFFAHIFVLLYGVAAFVLGKFRISPLWENAPSWLLEFTEKWFPEKVFQPWQPGTTELVSNPTRTYLISGGLVAYALYYLNSKHRG
jgi:hypothetical protein